MKYNLSILFLRAGTIGFCLILTILASNGVAQESYDVFMVRDYKSSATLSISNNSASKVGLRAYGTTLFSNTQNNKPRYVYQGQEIDNELGLYLFSSRIYSPLEKRFLQPDPKSQYHSPYLFVGADPVNLVDINGEEGKPLVLYQEDLREPGGLTSSISDLMEDIPNAHYVTMSDFINDRVGNLSEWNGNVFLKSHSAPLKDQEVIAEVLPKGKPSKISSLMARREMTRDCDFTTMDPVDIGKKLRTLSEQQGVEVKNIISGSCEGSVAAEKIGKGYIGKTSFGKKGKRLLRVIGLKKKRYAFFGGRKASKEPGIEGFEKTRMYVNDNFYGDFSFVAAKYSDGKFYLEDYKRFGAKADAPTLPFADSRQIEQFYNGRVPEGLANDIHISNLFY